MNKIEFYTYDRASKPGYVKRIEGRKVHEIAEDLRKAMDAAKMPYEYAAYSPWGELPWPMGNRQVDYCWLENGSNEGYSLFIATRYHHGDDRTGGWVHVEPLRIKLLCDEDDAFKVLRFVFNLIGGW